jgi:hypothetical protein
VDSATCHAESSDWHAACQGAFASLQVMEQQQWRSLPSPRATHAMQAHVISLSDACQELSAFTAARCGASESACSAQRCLRTILNTCNQIYSTGTTSSHVQSTGMHYEANCTKFRSVTSQTLSPPAQCAVGLFPPNLNSTQVHDAITHS